MNFLDQAQSGRTVDAMQAWDECLGDYPKWRFGGENARLEIADVDGAGNPCFVLSVENAGGKALCEYKELLTNSGFTTAGRYPSEDLLYKKIGGVCRCFNAEEPFSSDGSVMRVGFMIAEPYGGFDRVKTSENGVPFLF